MEGEPVERREGKVSKKWGGSKNGSGTKIFEKIGGGNLPKGTLCSTGLHGILPLFFVFCDLNCPSHFPLIFKT